ncbi:PadR family transcriptional regulator [Stella sp.]|uniref:PadR family transcriptional regulator n=1 Tax=Stella sp. TaxID=2912054 RepID=UPI0035AF4A76
MDVPTLCMAALSRAPATGYDIRKAFEEGPFAHFHEASFGSIYPALRRLEQEGAVAATEQPQERRPDRRIYALTDQGRDRLVRALRQPPREDVLRSDALVVLFFAHLVPPAEAVAVLDGYLAYHRRLLAQLAEPKERPECAGAGERFVHGLGVAVYEAAVRYLENHRAAFVDQLTGGGPKIA